MQIFSSSYKVIYILFSYLNIREKQNIAMLLFPILCSPDHCLQYILYKKLHYVKAHFCWLSGKHFYVFFCFWIKTSLPVLCLKWKRLPNFCLTWTKLARTSPSWKAFSLVVSTYIDGHGYKFNQVPLDCTQGINVNM